MIQKIKFKGRSYILINGGAIATLRQYQSGKVGYAHLKPDGRILRYGKQVGAKKDIKSIEEIKAADRKILPGATARIFEQWFKVLEQQFLIRQSTALLGNKGQTITFRRYKEQS